MCGVPAKYIEIGQENCDFSLRVWDYAIYVMLLSHVMYAGSSPYSQWGTRTMPCCWIKHKCWCWRPSCCPLMTTNSMDLTHTSRLDSNDGCANHVCRGECFFFSFDLLLLAPQETRVEVFPRTTNLCIFFSDRIQQQSTTTAEYKYKYKYNYK